MTALARTIDIGAGCALVCLHDVPAAARARDPHGRGKHERAQRRRHRRQREPTMRHPGQSRIAPGTEQVHRIAVLHESAEKAGSGALDAAVEHEGPAHDEDLHLEVGGSGRPPRPPSARGAASRASRPPSARAATCSNSGKRRSRAARKL